MALRWSATPENERVNAAKVAGVRDRLSGLVTQVQDLSATIATQDSDLETTGFMAVDEPPLTRADFGNPPKTKQQEAVKPTLTSINKPDAGNSLGGWVNTAQSTAQSIFASWTKPNNNAPKSNDLKSKEPKNKTVYVRKSFKDEGIETITETLTETITETVIPVDQPSFQSVTDAKDSEVDEGVETVVETKVVEVLDEFGDAIDGLKQDI